MDVAYVSREQREYLRKTGFFRYVDNVGAWIENQCSAQESSLKLSSRSSAELESRMTQVFDGIYQVAQDRIQDMLRRRIAEHAENQEAEMQGISSAEAEHLRSIRFQNFVDQVRLQAQTDFFEQRVQHDLSYLERVSGSKLGQRDRVRMHIEHHRRTDLRRERVQQEAVNKIDTERESLLRDFRLKERSRKSEAEDPPVAGSSRAGRDQWV